VHFFISLPFSILIAIYISLPISISLAISISIFLAISFSLHIAEYKKTSKRGGVANNLLRFAYS
jgi:hypothetical protein